MQNYITNIEQSTDTIGSEELQSFDLTPNEVIEENYGLEEFGKEAYSSTIIYHQNKVFYPSDLKENNPNWLVLVFILCFGLTAFVRGFHRKRLGLLTNALVNWKFGKQIIRYEKLYTHPVNIALALNFLIATPLFFALCYNQLSNRLISLFNLSLLLAAYLLLFSLLKLITYKLSAWVFNSSEEIKEYIFQTNLIAKFLGLVFIVLALLLCYSKVNFQILLWVGIAVLIIGIGLQVIRGFLIGLQKSKDLILIILYLCTLEILPLIILGKIVLNEH